MCSYTKGHIVARLLGRSMFYCRRLKTFNSGFGEAFISSTKHDLLLRCIDYSSEELDAVIKFLQLRLKADSDYQNNLKKVVDNGRKFSPSLTPQGRPLAVFSQAFQQIVDQTEQILRQQQAAIQSQEKLIELLNFVASERKKLRYTFADENKKICQEDSKVRRAFEKASDEYKKCNSSGRTLYSHMSGPPLTDEKYIKLIMRTHNRHNDCLTAFKERQCWNNALLTDIIPQLLNYVQWVMVNLDNIQQFALMKLFRAAGDSSIETSASQLQIERTLVNIDVKAIYDRFIQEYGDRNFQPAKIVLDADLQSTISAFYLTDTDLVSNEVTCTSLIERRMALQAEYDSLQSVVDTTPVFVANVSFQGDIVNDYQRLVRMVFEKYDTCEMRCRKDTKKCVLDFLDQAARRAASRTSDTPPVRAPNQSLPRRRQFDSTASDEADDGQEKVDRAQPLEQQPWFHGCLPRSDVVPLLKTDGDFLVRQSDNPGRQQLVISACSQLQVRHFPINFDAKSSTYKISAKPYASVPELIYDHLANSIGLGRQSDTKLTNPIKRAEWELDNDLFEFRRVIGQGNFGEIHLAVYQPLGVECAVKRATDDLSKEERDSLISEARVQRSYSHPNIVRFIGIAAKKEPVLLAMEYCRGGSLQGLLRSNKDRLAAEQLLAFCFDVAKGMAYLSIQPCIHRDLAARNCLLADNNVVKISDFGLSRMCEIYMRSSANRPLPVRWTAPEAYITKTFTTKSDVWSYGVLIWEIYSFAAVPYGTDIDNEHFMHLLAKGHDLPALRRPEACPNEMYEILTRCLQRAADMRPDFQQLCHELANLSGSKRFR